MNPIFPATAVVFFMFAVFALAMTWRTIANMWERHGSAEKLAERQLATARKNELLYRAAAEEYSAAADGYARTVARLAAGPLPSVTNLKDYTNAST